MKHFDTNTVAVTALLAPLSALLAPPLVVSLAVSLVALLPATTSAQEGARPGLEYRGAVATGLALRRLGHTGRVLHIGAHPDDENTALFSPLALGRGVDAAYLSLTRGEGGQNGIGPELGTALGLIRSEELLAARRLDGAAQFFTRAIDFGFSKTAEETFRHWPRDSLVADIVAVIRRYRPDVVVSVWSGTRRDGHGQHEASGLLSHEAVVAAGDPERFPEQIAAGLRPHSPRLYYWSARYGADGPDVELNTGALDPLLGRSYHQVAMASRSRHRSQDMGVPQAAGPRRTAFDRIDPANPPEVAMSGERRPSRQLEGRSRLAGSLFAGVDTLLSQRAEAAGAPGAAEHLRAYESLVVEIVHDRYDALAPWSVLPGVLGANARLGAARAALDEREARDEREEADERAGAGAEASSDTGAEALEDLRYHIAAEQRDLRDVALAAANLQMDAVSDEELIVPGQTFELELSAWSGSVAGAYVRMEPALPPGWSAWPAGSEEPAPAGRPGIRAEPETFELEGGDRVVRRWTVHVPGDAEPTRPYFLGPEAPGTSTDLYDWPDDPSLWGLPFAENPVRGRFVVEFRPVPVRTPDAGRRTRGADGDDGFRAPPDAAFELTREAAFVGVDARSGEYRRPVRVVPGVSVGLTPRLVVVPRDALRDAGRRTLTFRAHLRNEIPDGTPGELRTAVWEGWSPAVPSTVDVALDEEGAERTIGFDVTLPADLAPGEYGAGVLFEAPGCGGAAPCPALDVFTSGYELIDYPHIDPHHLYRPAEASIRVLDVRVADVRVGYVAGVPDGVPQALDQLGVAWEALDEAALAEGDLSGFDVIVTGTRAYEVRPDLVAHNHRMLDWARAGGTLVVQYNKYPALEGSYAPWPITIARPHGRVTDETAPVDVLVPDHPIFNTPNPIGPDDWKGWVQERGLYFWETWEGPLEPLVAMHDPGEDPLRGALLAGPLGDGTYVYSALALFRQLPEGVPGAYRLLANLISLGADTATIEGSRE